MPIIKSSAKRMRQNKNRYRENLRAKRRMRQAIKDVSEYITRNQEKEAREYLDAAQKAIDKAVKKGVVNKNTAARKKSQLSRHVEETFGTQKSSSKGVGGKSSASTKQSAQKTTAAKKPTQSKSSSASTAKKQTSGSKSSSSAKKQTSQSKQTKK